MCADLEKRAYSQDNMCVLGADSSRCVLHFRGVRHNNSLTLQTLRLWEAIWSCPLTAHFPIYLCAAALQLNKERIMQCGPCFDELLSFCVLLSGNMDLSRTMRRAENLFQAAGSRGLKCLQGLETVP